MPNKKKGRKKLSLYQKTTRQFWKVVKDKRKKGEKISYIDAKLKLKNIYVEVKQLQQNTDKSVFKGSTKKDYNFIKRLYRVTRVEPIDYIQEEEIFLPSDVYGGEYSTYWFDFNSTMELLQESTPEPIYDNITFTFDLDDSGSPNGINFQYNSIVENGITRPIKIDDISSLFFHTEFWDYCRKANNGLYNDSPPATFYIKERNGNKSVKYGITKFTAGNGTSVVPTPIEKPVEPTPIEEPVKPTESESIKLQELKNKENEIKLEIEKEKTKREEKYFELLSEGKIDAAMFERLVNQLYK
jgi:hypothetical protein